MSCTWGTQGSAQCVPGENTRCARSWPVGDRPNEPPYNSGRLGLFYVQNHVQGLTLRRMISLKRGLQSVCLIVIHELFHCLWYNLFSTNVEICAKNECTSVSLSSVPPKNSLISTGTPLYSPLITEMWRSDTGASSAPEPLALAMPIVCLQIRPLPLWIDFNCRRVKFNIDDLWRSKKKHAYGGYSTVVNFWQRHVLLSKDTCNL